MAIKEQIEQVVNKLKSDPTLLEKFQKNPTEAVEGILGVDLPDGAGDKIIDGVKEKLGGGKLSGVLDSVKKLF